MVQAKKKARVARTTLSEDTERNKAPAMMSETGLRSGTFLEDEVLPFRSSPHLKQRPSLRPIQ